MDVPMMLSAFEIGVKLKKLRGELPVSRVSEETGIGISAINNYEAGIRIPRDEAKIRLAHYYGTTVDDLFYSHDDT